MKYEFRLLAAYLFIVSGVFTTLFISERRLPGRIDDLPPSEIEVVTQLRTLGYEVKTDIDGGFGKPTALLSVFRTETDNKFHLVEVSFWIIPDSTSEEAITQSLLALPHLQRAHVGGFSKLALDRLRVARPDCEFSVDIAPRRSGTGGQRSC